MNVAAKHPIQFKLDWIDRSDGVEYRTLAAISLLADGIPIWPVKGEDTDDFQWYADELLAHLTECWKPLNLRQNYPIPVKPDRPSFLLAEAAKRWSELPSTAIESEQGEVAAFEDVHNLANAFGGITGLLPLWFLRDQNVMIIDTQELFLRVPLKDALHALVSVGNAIADRLQKAHDQKWDKLLTAWKRRDQGDVTLLLAFTIGRDQRAAAELIAEHVLEPPKSFDDAVSDNDELRIAARMAGPMPLNQIKTVLTKVREVVLTRAPRLQEVAEDAVAFVDSDELRDARPHVQGNELAIWLRRKLNLSAQRNIDPERILEKQFGVSVFAIDFGIGSLDAVAVWGPKHGPAVLLNKTSNRVGRAVNIWRNGAARVTAAHELCHFLLDSRHTLSAVDVLGGRMPNRIEQRAKAFAAEFLLPSKEAGDVWRSHGYPLDKESLHPIIRLLCRRYSVTESVAAWQLQHGASAAHWEELDRVLDDLVPRR
jgi:Zn-dependent peptidase ImmA (M78 family)